MNDCREKLDDLLSKPAITDCEIFSLIAEIESKLDVLRDRFEEIEGSIEYPYQLIDSLEEQVNILKEFDTKNCDIFYKELKEKRNEI